MKKILIIEDEKDMASIISSSLKEENFDTYIVSTGKTAFDSFLSYNPDLVLLDINLPVVNGWDICKQIKNISKTPIIMVTARDSEFDEIKGLEIGADDYITKPFTPKLLILKIKKLLKIENTTFFKYGNISFNLNTFTLTVGENSEVLTKREGQLLEYLMRNENIIFSRETLLNEVWGFEFIGDDRAVDTIIKRVRKKLSPYDNYIKSVRGVGYVFKTT